MRLFNEKGFTLIEVIAIMVVIGILAETVRVEVRETSETSRLHTATYEFMADLRYAQEMAMNARRQVRFVVQHASDRYYAQFTDTGEMLKNARGDNLDVRLSAVPEYRGVDITGSETGSNLIFTTTGRPTISGSFFDGSDPDRIVFTLNNDVEIYVINSGLTSFSSVRGGRRCGC